MRRGGGEGGREGEREERRGGEGREKGGKEEGLILSDIQAFSCSAQLPTECEAFSHLGVVYASHLRRTEVSPECF